MKFYYHGVTRQKEKVSGIVDAIDELDARARLRMMQILPSQISQRKMAAMDLSWETVSQINIGPAIDLKGLMVFTRQFSSLIDSGVPVVQCLDLLHKQEKRAAFQKILLQIKKDIEAGMGLAEAMRKHSSVFGDFFVQIVEAGEISGTLDKALRRVGVQLEKLGRIRAKVISALTYPVITLVIALFVLCFLLVRVIPEIAKLYGDSSAKLPELTQQVLFLSVWFQKFYWLIGIIMGGTVVIGIFLYRQPQFREIWDPFVLRVPLFGSLIKKATVARFTRTLSTLITSGVPLLQAFDICSKLISNRALRKIIENTSRFVSEGKGIAEGLSRGGVFPPMVIHMVNIGEMTGKLDELLGKVSDIFDDEVDDAIGRLTTLLQPTLIVFVGAIIAFLLTAMYLPIFQLAEKVGG